MESKLLSTSRVGGQQPLSYCRIGRADLGAISTLELEQEQVERFLGPIDDIVATVRNGLAHVIYAIDATDRMVGFYVIHPDRRDGSPSIAASKVKATAVGPWLT